MFQDHFLHDHNFLSPSDPATDSHVEKAADTATSSGSAPEPLRLADAFLDPSVAIALAMATFNARRRTPAHGRGTVMPSVVMPRAVMRLLALHADDGCGACAAVVDLLRRNGATEVCR